MPAPAWTEDASTTASDSDSDWSQDDQFADKADTASDDDMPGDAGDVPELHMAMHKMLSHLSEWWTDSEQLLQLMASKSLPCKTLEGMSDKIDKLLDNAIETIINSPGAEPAVFPMTRIVQLTREIKRYLFLKVGEVCCQKGNADKCAATAKTALVSLKKFRTAAHGVYDTMIAQALDGLDESPGPGMDTPEIEALLKQLGGR